MVLQTENEKTRVDLHCPLCSEINQLTREISSLSRAIRRNLKKENAILCQQLSANTKAQRQLRTEQGRLKDLPQKEKEAEENRVKAALDKLIAERKPLREALTRIEKASFDKSPVPRLRNQLSYASRSHPKCDGCTLLFGYDHLATRTKEFHRLSLCQYCARDLAKVGAELFMKRLKWSVTEATNSNDEDEYHDNKAEDFEEYG